MSAEQTFSMFSSTRDRALQAGLRLVASPDVPQQLLEKYRPSVLADLVGQEKVVKHLGAFVKAPYATVLLFTGETGVGKTSGAYALAHEMGVDMEWGFHRVSSGEMDQEAVERIQRELRFACTVGSRWRVVLCDEIDQASAKAKVMWLSKMELDAIPVRTVLIFTTNHAEKLEQRFVDRCQPIRFVSEPVGAEAQRLLARVWTGEQLPGEVPSYECIPDLVVRGAISYRRLVQWVAQRMREPDAPLPDVEAIRAERVQAAKAVAQAPIKSKPVRKASEPVAQDEVFKRRRAAALKAWETMRAKKGG